MRIVLFVIALAASVSASAQPLYQVTPARTYGAKETRKQQHDFHVFWSAARKVFPPLPFNPFPELKVYDAGNNNLIYDDREVDYPALEAAMSKERAETEAEAAALAKDAGGGGMALRSSSSSTNLTLAMPVFDGTNLQLTIENGVAGEFYDLFYSTNLVDWHFYVRTDTNQFSFAIAPPAWPVCFFRLGTQQDTDDDTLTDAYEALITQTSPGSPNTLQNLNQLTNLTAGQITTASNNLIDHLPLLILHIYEQDYSWALQEPLCSLPLGNHYDSTSHRTRWTNNVGGIFTNSLVMNYCVSNNAVFTNRQLEGRMPTNYLGTGYIRQRVDNDAWSTWEEDWYGLPWTGGLSPHYRRTRDLTVLSTNPPESYLETDALVTRMRYSTRGPQLSALERRHKIHIDATANDRLGNQTPISSTNFTFPGLGNLRADANGDLYVTLRDNRTNDLTPSLPSAYTNYDYSISAERHLIPLIFRTSGYLTGPDENFDGYDGQKYLNWALVLATNLGVHATPDDGTLGGIGTNIVNAEEISATVPTIPAVPSGFWRWHQDKQLKRYLWTNGATTVRILGDVSFSTLGPDDGNDTPTPSPGANPAWDSAPDTFGRVYFPDAPSLKISDPDLLNAPLNSIAALRFYGHTWLTGDGAFASPVLKWRTFITIKKTTNGWVRVGQNFIQETPSGVSEDPVFPISEPSGL